MIFRETPGPVVAMCLLAMSGSASAQQSGSGDVAIANPAAVFCVERGGSFETRVTAEGRRGMCRLPDGTVVDAWAHFRENWDKPRKN